MAAMTALATALAVGGLATSVWGQIKAGKAQKKAAQTAATATTEIGKLQRKSAEAQAELADYNQAVADLQAEDAVDRGAEAESRFRTQVRGAIGAQRAAFAGGNIDVGFGSAVDVQADAAFLGEMDALQIRTNAAREAWGFKVQAEDYRRRGDIMRREGVNAEEAARINANAQRQSGGAAQTASYWGAASSLLGGGASLLAMRYQFRNG